MNPPADLPSRCPACNCNALQPFWQCQQMPTDVGSTAETADAARNVQRGDIQLCYCHHCQLVHNRKFNPATVQFKPGYEVGLYHSQVFLNFIVALADRLVRQFDLYQRRVTDIGCGDGYFLRQLLTAGVAEAIGIDPSCQAEGPQSVPKGKLSYVRDVWSVDHAGLIGDFVVSQSMLEAIPEPLKFMQSIRAAIGDRDVPLYLEVFHGYRALERCEAWSVHYEQCNYFSESSLAGLVRRAGFEVTASGPCYEGDQYIYVEARPDHAPSVEPSPSESTSDELPEVIARFSAVHQQQRERWLAWIDQWRQQNSRVLVWGSGGKGISLLNTTNVSDVIEYVVDINPDRQGGFIPGAGQQIIPPQRVPTINPDVIVLTNALYEAEIRRQLADLNVTCDVVTA